jgi:hypothetical protein
MNTDLNSGLLKMSVGLQSFKDELLAKLLAPQPTPVGQQIGQVMMSLFKHLVQGVLVISAGTLAYNIVEKTALAEVTGLSGMMAFLAGSLAVKYFYLPATVVGVAKVLPVTDLTSENADGSEEDDLYFHRDHNIIHSNELTNDYYDDKS